MQQRKTTVYDLHVQKGQRKWLHVHVDSAAEATACLEVDVVPVQLADHITRTAHMITMGTGCGTVCDTQYLFSSDILDTNTGHDPRHSCQYADFARLEQNLQAKRVAAFEAFARDVATAGYPAPEHQVEMTPAAYETFPTLSQKV